MALKPTYESSETDTTIYSKLRFDLSDIIQKLQNEEYKTGDKIKSPKFSIGDYTATFSVYPAGDRETSVTYCSVYLDLSSKSNNAHVEFIVHCDAAMISFTYPIQIFKGGRGWSKAFKNHTVVSSDSKCFIIEIKIFDEGKQLAKPYNFNHSYSKQQELIYKNSKENGDIILVIQKEQICIESEPERKKRKNVNNKINNTEEGGDTEMKVSSVILRSASPVFAGMFGHTFVENNDKKIVIITINKQDVDDMYYYICTNQLRLNVNPVTLIKLAHLYELTSLFNACSNRIIVELSIENFVESANTFNRYGIENNYKKLVEFGKENLKEIKKQSNFQDLSFAFKYGILGCGSP